MHCWRQGSNEAYAEAFVRWRTGRADTGALCYFLTELSSIFLVFRSMSSMAKRAILPKKQGSLLRMHFWDDPILQEIAQNLRPSKKVQRQKKRCAERNVQRDAKRKMHNR